MDAEFQTLMTSLSATDHQELLWALETLEADAGAPDDGSMAVYIMCEIIGRYPNEAAAFRRRLENPLQRRWLSALESNQTDVLMAISFCFLALLDNLCCDSFITPTLSAADARLLENLRALLATLPADLMKRTARRKVRGKRSALDFSLGDAARELSEAIDTIRNNCES